VFEKKTKQERRERKKEFPEEGEGIKKGEKKNQY